MSHPLFLLSSNILSLNTKAVGGQGRMAQDETVFVYTFRAQAFGKGKKGKWILTERVSWSPCRSKYFHGKKVNGDIEIRVEQVGGGPFPHLPFSEQGSFPRATFLLSYVVMMNEDCHKNPGFFWSTDFSTF